MNWDTEFAELSSRDRQTPLDLSDLERLAIAAYLTGREAESVEILTRAHNAALEVGLLRQAARMAFWIGFVLNNTSERTLAAGWFQRGRRLLDDSGDDCVERGFLMMPQALERVAAGDVAGAAAAFTAVEAVGRKFGDRDLMGLGRMGCGRALIAQGRRAEGAALLDEVMVAVTADELSPIITGIVYCSVISACFEVADVRRAQAWTDSLNDWCAAQPGLVPYRGECLVHRADLLRLRGRWPEALDAARRAYDALTSAKRPGRGTAAYTVGELHRLHGDISSAEEAYRRAGELGRSPHPGLALLRLAQGRKDDARSAITRVLLEQTRGRQRIDVLAAAVEILLASDDRTGARAAADELDAIARTTESPWLRAMSLQADGAVQLADGHAESALVPLREAVTIWQELDAPYEGARATVLAGLTCRQLGDHDGAQMEFDAAARIFRDVGAVADLARVEALQAAPAATPGGLTSREVEVLRLIASGKSNRAIAEALDISEKTVARHVSNIFTKLDLPSRAAATAYAFTHGLAG
jgi:DNA-binding CsgD family transcriptional regulator